MIGRNIQKSSKRNGRIISMKNLKDAKKAIGFPIMALLLTLLALITCTCSGPRLTLANQTSVKQIDYFSFSGRLARPTQGLTECVTLKIVDLDSHLCPQLRQLTLPRFHLIHDSGYCPNLGLMLKRCSQIRLYQYRLTTRSSSNLYRTVWTDRRQNSPTGFQPRSLQENQYRIRTEKSSKVLTQPSTGRTQGTTRMMVKNLHY